MKIIWKYEKSILVTGGCGFIGSNFVNYMVQKYPNYFILSLDAMYYCASEDNLLPKVIQAPNFKMKKGNINEYYLILSLIEDYGITDIVHFAAQSHVDHSFDNSLQYTDDNVKGTHTLLEVVRKHQPEIRFFHFSTDEVYGESQLDEDPKHEMSVLCPTNPYAASKAAAEMLVNAYRHSYQMKTIITRCNNVYGPNQYPEKLIPRFIMLLKENKKCTIHGKGESLRSFIHVDDVCSAMDLILVKGVVGEIYNIGSENENELTVKNIADILIQELKPNEPKENWIEFVEDRPFNDKRYFITNHKIKSLGWQQKVNFMEGLKKLL
jgi:dTDP-glucose 4,6-dehydratase/UDP-glucose 4,6-dehydratase